MAQRKTVELVDDLDQTAATQTIRFAVGGTQYEIDLNDKNADAFYSALNPYIEAALAILS